MLLALQVTVLSSFRVALHKLGTANLADLHFTVRQSSHRHVASLVDTVALVLEGVNQFHQSASFVDFCVFNQELDLQKQRCKKNTLVSSIYNA